MEQNNKIQRPLIVEMEDVKVEIAQVINKAIQEHNLPLYLIDMIFSEFATQIKDGARRELEMAKNQMQASADNKPDENKETA